MSWIEIVSALLGLSCVFLAGRNSKYNFWIGYVYNIFLFILFWRQHLYSAMILQPIAFGLNAFGQWRWSHPREDEKSASDPNRLKVSKMSTTHWLIAVGLIALCGADWALFLRDTADPSPWLDSYILMMTFFAQYLSAQKKWECWIVWLVINFANIVLYISSGLYVMPVVSALYLANGIWSLISWRKLFHSQE